MADPTHEQRLRDGVIIWNAWRRAMRRTIPDLVSADLSGLDLRGADLARANLAGAKLVGTRLEEADLCAATLVAADLSGARFDRALLGEADLSKSTIAKASFRQASCVAARFHEVDATSADFAGADIREAAFEDALELPKGALGVKPRPRAAMVRCVLGEGPLEAHSRFWHALWDFMGSAGFTAPADFARPRTRLSAIFEADHGRVDALREVCRELQRSTTREGATKGVQGRKDPRHFLQAIDQVAAVGVRIDDFVLVKWSVLGDAHIRAGFLEPELKEELDQKPELLADPASLMRRLARQRPGQEAEREAMV